MVRFWTNLLGGWLAFVVGACSATVEDSPPVDGETTVQAAIVIEHKANAGSAESVSGRALAGFVSVPTNVDPLVAMQLVGFEPNWPEAPGCRMLGGEPTAALASMGQLELLDVGGVEISTKDSAAKLIARAFPTVPDSIAGLMYTSRDVTNVQWAPGVEYGVRTSGGPMVPALSLVAQAPGGLTSVTVGGTPLAMVSTLVLDQPIDLTWSVGNANDVVWVELTSRDASSGAVCAFNDDAGTGTLPAQTGFESGPGTLTIHRSHSVEFSGDGVEHGTVRFDSAVSQSVDLRSSAQ